MIGEIGGKRIKNSMPKLPSQLKTDFPYLSDLNGKQTSDATEKYNCIAWAYGADNNWFWPDPD